MTTPNSIREYFAKIGSKGGRANRGTALAIAKSKLALATRYGKPEEIEKARHAFNVLKRSRAQDARV